jgi:hypothetical protein
MTTARMERLAIVLQGVLVENSTLQQQSLQLGQDLQHVQQQHHHLTICK